MNLYVAPQDNLPCIYPVKPTLVFSLRSYQYQWSSHCLSSSIGGWAPYCSLDGMFRSSTNAICVVGIED